ncbi:MAG: beta-lactamase family protein [Treponemataceae bacterium]|nr:beta-lactamase family protein [Treponemataceae bacterium]
MKKNVLLLIVSLSFIGNLFVSCSTPASEEEKTYSGSAEDIIKSFVSDNSTCLAGVSISCFTDTDYTFTYNSGFEDMENQIPVTDDTVMDWGSCSKLLVWVSAMQLWEQGKLDLDCDIQTYLPDAFLKKLTYNTPITFKNLMNHNAGFEESISGIMTTHENRIETLEEYLTNHQPAQIWEPGTTCAYSNWSTTLAAYIIQRITGIDYAEYVRQHIFEPLGMKKSAIKPDLSDNLWVRERRFELKSYTSEGTRNSIDFLYIPAYAAGSCASTIGDMAIFGKALLMDDSPLFKKPSTREEMLSPTLYYADGIHGRNFHGLWDQGNYASLVVGHGGNTISCSSSIYLDLEHKKGLVILTNQKYEETMNNGLADVIFGSYSGPEVDASGLYRTQRTVFKGPLSLYKITGLGVFPQGTTAPSYMKKDGRLLYPYGDFLEFSIKDVFVDYLFLLLYIIALCASVFVLLKNLVRRIAGAASDAWTNLSCFSILLPFVLLVVMIPSLLSGDQWAMWHYKALLILQWPLFFCSILLAAVKHDKDGMTKKQRRCITRTRIYLIFSILNVIYWGFLEFWRF